MTDVAKRCLGYVVAGAIALALLLVVARKVDGWLGGTADAATTAISKNQVKLHASQVKIRAHLRAVQAANQHVMDSLVARGRAAEATNAFDTTDYAAAMRWKGIALFYKAAADACPAIVRACDAGAASGASEADTLTGALTDQIRVRNHPCGVTLGLGATVGVTTAGGLGMAGGLTLLVGCQLVRSPWP